MKENEIPSAFWWRRAHSFTGLILTIYIIFHLYTNSLAVFDDGNAFITAVNDLHHIPYLIFLELFIIALPLLIHAIWGIYYLRTAEPNSYRNDGKDPYLPNGRNRAYTWQRITSWILLFGIIFHVAHMRFIEMPSEVYFKGKNYYEVRVSEDPGLIDLTKKLSIEFMPAESKGSLVRADSFGAAELIMVREAFKSPILILIYTIFVLAACFHGFNGLWTFMITWGVTLTVRSQRIMLYISTVLMFIVLFFGLASIYGAYWINLRS